MEVETHIDNFNKSFFVGEIITGNVTIKNRERYTDLYYCNVTLRVIFIFFITFRDFFRLKIQKRILLQQARYNFLQKK